MAKSNVQDEFKSNEFRPLEPSESSRMPLPVYGEASLDYSPQNDHLLLPIGNDVKYSGIFCPVAQGAAILARDLWRLKYLHELNLPAGYAW